jgi:hypothetical protein
MPTTLKEGDPRAGRPNNLLPIRVRAGNAEQEETSAGPGRVLPFTTSLTTRSKAERDEKQPQYQSLTRPQKMIRIMGVVLNDDLAEDKLDAILWRIEDITAASSSN